MKEWQYAVLTGRSNVQGTWKNIKEKAQRKGKGAEGAISTINYPRNRYLVHVSYRYERIYCNLEVFEWQGVNAVCRCDLVLGFVLYSFHYFVW